jgi:hypothetical protein
METILLLILTIVVVALCGLMIYMYMKVMSIDKYLSVSVAEIKSKIGSLIREINRINQIEYNIDVSQQKDINKLKTNNLMS